MGFQQQISGFTTSYAARRITGAVHETENAKVVITESKRKLLKRCMIHIVPILTTITILALNLRGVYIGQDFSGPIKFETINLLLLQIAAKFHELLVVASLSFIVCHAVRHELLFGQGLPLGLVSSGLTFSSFEFFFSKEFYGAVGHWLGRENAMKKLAFVALLLVSGTIATLVGPSSAILLVPKSQPWPSGNTKYYLDGTPEDLWPSDLSGSLEELQAYCNENNSASLATCPAGGYYSLWEHWGRTDFSNFYRTDTRAYAKRMSGSRFYWPINSPNSQVPPRYLMGGARHSDDNYHHTFLVLPHAAPVMILQQIMEDWWDAIAPNDNLSPSLIDDRLAYSTYNHAISTVRCSQPQNLSSMDTKVSFPSLKGRFDYADNMTLNVPELSTAAVDHLKFSWIHLPDEFGALSIGGIFESAWVNNSSRAVLACSVQAGWVPAEARTDEYSFWTGWYPWNVTFGDRTPSFVGTPEGAPLGTTNGRIAMGDTWLDLLTPGSGIRKHSSSNERPTTIESILEAASLDNIAKYHEYHTLVEQWEHEVRGNGTRSRIIEAIICSVIVDGISRHGSHRVYSNASSPADLALFTYQKLPDFKRRILNGEQALSQPTLPEASLTMLEVSIQITGFAIRRTLTGYLAMIVLMTHLLMATCHVVLMAWSKHSSGSWSTATELIALSRSSKTPATCLENTGAGLSHSKTLAQVARIRVVPHAETARFDHVELVFDVSRTDERYSKVTQNTDHMSLIEGRSGSVSKHLAVLHERADSVSGTGGLSRNSSTEALFASGREHSKDQVLETVRVGRPYC